MSFLQSIFGSKNQREINKLLPTVQRIAALEPTMQQKSDTELRSMTGEFRSRLANGVTLDAILPEAFAVCREASKRALGMRHYDVQMIGGMVLHSGRIAEMRTGEGKTLVATLPAYLNALAGKGVHVVTVNDYLARRDAEWMGKLYGFLGLTTGVIVHGLTDQERQANYGCDITYGQNNEFGFDYLRDNMKQIPDRMVQRELHYAIVDEVDSILIDEARTPLIISGPSEGSADLYHTVDRIMPKLKREVDYTVDEKSHSAMLTDEGVDRVEKLLSVDNLYSADNLSLNHHVQQALKAHTLYKRDVNYLIETDETGHGKVVIIDEHTGRKMPGRRWSDGLHQAIEAKEGVEVEEENQTVATITFQNYFRMYKKLSGMTGTADTEASEFKEIYKLDICVIPTNKPLIRNDQADLVYKNEAGKFRAVLADIEDCHRRGQPVLVGTVSVEKSEVIARFLRDKNIPFHVLNAKQHMREAAVVAQAGRKGAITIATNMAGRGTDILLGGNAEAMAKADLDAISTDDLSDDERDAKLADLIAQYKPQCDAEKAEVLAAGGLKIIGTERHESRRIDNQLRGRAGRQGDPGTSRFYLSLQDDLLRIFGLDKMTGLMERLGLEEDVPIESPMVTRSIENAQKKVEGQNFDRRKNVLEYDDVMNQQRKTIYALRRQILLGKYAHDVTPEEAARGKLPVAPTQSGILTVPDLAHLMRPRVEELLQRLVEAGQAAGAATDPAALQRIGRHEIWRQYGALVDLPEFGALTSGLVDQVTEACAASWIQQRERIYDTTDDVVLQIVRSFCNPQINSESWDWDGLEDAIKAQFGVAVDVKPGTVDEVAGQIWPPIQGKLEQRETELGRAFLMYFGRHFALEEIDKQWIEHLKMMESLREGIGLQGYGQKDPKKEYKKAGFDLFTEMMARIKVNTVQNLFFVQVQRQEQQVPDTQQRERALVEAGAANKVDESTQSTTRQAHTAGAIRPPEARATAASEPVRRDANKVGRNDPCPCGSGKKYKKCHGQTDNVEA